jgi:O-antigen biosynthesis protein WbqP
MYRHFLKRVLDFFLSGIGILCLTPVWLLLSLLILIDDPGPIFFTQKRVGRKKKLFRILKFRTMKTSTPHDTPTHLLENPEQYITRVGKLLRKTSLDELPQIFNIFVGQMSVIGPRPALWNQDDLIAERDRYGANDVRPGLTGRAQINGRDELEIPVKARLDGEYVERLSFAFDCRCFFGTVRSVLSSDGVVEGGTGQMARSAEAEPTEALAPEVTEAAEPTAEPTASKPSEAEAPDAPDAPAEEASV